MGEYLVVGASRTTGAPGRMLVDAASELEALEVAHARGLLVSGVDTDPGHIAAHRAERSAWQAARATQPPATPSPPPAAPPTSGPPAPIADRDPWRRPETAITWSLTRDVNLVVVIAAGVCGGLMLFSCVGPAMMVGGLAALVGLGSSEPTQGRGPSRGAEVPKATAPVRREIAYAEAPVPDGVAAGPARDVSWGVEDGDLRMGLTEFEALAIDGAASHVRWRVQVSNFGEAPIVTGLSAALFGSGGREVWRGGGWLVTIPPGRQMMVERTEPLGSARLGERDELRLRAWTP